MVNNNNEEEEPTGIIGMIAEKVESIKTSFFGDPEEEEIVQEESLLGPSNALGIKRPLASINLARQFSDIGGITPDFITGSRKRLITKSKRKQTKAPYRPRRHRPQTSQIPRTPQRPAPNGIAQPDRVEIRL